MLISRFSALLSAAVVCVVTAHATVFYISPTGNDNLSGTSQTSAWATLDKVNAMANTFNPGDQILFQRGGTWRGTLNAPRSGAVGNPIIYGAYGSGSNPVFSGSRLCTSWTTYSGNIWRAQVGTNQGIPYVYVNGARQQIARYPNTGWLRNDQGSATTIYDNALTQASGHWNGATVVIRGTNWSYDLATVSNFSNSTLTFNTIWYDLTNLDWGYFLCNKLSELDMAGEWYYDSVSGYLYLWAPGNANPNSLTVEAATRDRGVDIYWSRQYINVQNIDMKHYRAAGVWVDGASYINVSGCNFSELKSGVRTVGNNNTYDANTYNWTYGNAADLQDDYGTVSNSTFTNCAMVAGLGESNWGYMGIRSQGDHCTIRNNRLTNIGYIGIATQKTVLVEKNVVDNATALLNDGGGIGIDRCDGAIVQDNIVRNCPGNLDSSAPDWLNYHPIAHAIYFGNIFVKNSHVRRNVCYNNGGSGINVDHTMLNTNNYVQDNILYNNIRQISISDYSNNVGQGAVSPYFVANFGETYSGNTYYSLAPDQECMYIYNCYSTTSVDWGTMANNKYFNPYNELSIYSYKLMGPVQKFYTVGHWATERSEDAGSTSHPLKQNLQATVSELSGNLIQNGTYDANVTGWTAWPTNSQITRVTTHLDNGALKANIPNNSVYWEQIMRNPDQFAMSSGQWYRMRFSIQSGSYGEVRAGVKAMSQITGGLPTSIYEKRIPFDANRREVEFYFQSNLSENALAQFINHYTEPMFYLDNVQLHRVSVQQLNPHDSHTILCNDQGTAQTMSLPAGCWKDLSGTTMNGTVTVPPFSAKVFYKVPDTQCTGGGGTGGTLGARVMLGGAYNIGTGLMRDDLRVANRIPTAEPYSAMGYTMENAGATVSGTLLATTGNTAIVDWVLVELKNNNGGYTVAARRACLVRRDGTVVGTDGSTVLSFTSTTTAGKYVVIRHRNHLGVMSASPLSSNGAAVDFSPLTAATYGTNGQQIIGTVKAMWPGNVSGDNSIRYTGAGNDRDPILNAIGGTVPTAYVGAYLPEDVNMDAWVLYTGNGNDRDPILALIGGIVPTSVIMEQVP